MKQLVKLTIFLLMILAAAQLSTAQKPELVVQTGHSDYVSSVTLSPDGRTLASASWDNTIRLWNIVTGQELRTLRSPSGMVFSVAFSPDNKTLASGGTCPAVFGCTTANIKLWDIGTGRELRSFVGHLGSPVNSVAFSPNGKILATGGGDSMIRLWDVDSGQELRSLKGHSGGTSAAFSSDGKTLASIGSGDTIKLWDAASGRELRTLTGQSIAFSSDGKTVATGNADRTIKLSDVSSGRELKTLKDDTGVGHVAFSPNGWRLASVSNSSVIKLWDLATGQVIKSLEGHSGLVRSIVFSSDGETLVSGGEDRTIRIWDVARGYERKSLRAHSRYIGSMAFSPDGNTFATGGIDSTIRLWNLASGQQFGTVKAESSVFAFSPDGKVLACGKRDGTMKFWDIAEGRELSSLKANAMLFVLSPDGKTVASGSYSRIKLWDVASGQELKTLQGHFGEVSSLAFSPDSKVLATGSQDSTTKLWEIASGQEIRTLRGHSHSVTTLVFSPEGRTLVSGSFDGTVRRWDVWTGQALRTLNGHSDVIFSIAFSRDGTQLATGSRDETIRLWNVASGLEVKRLKSNSSVNALAFSLDGRTLTTGGSDGRIDLWDVNSGTRVGSLIAIDENDWMVATPDGLFDGSPSAWNKILWRFNNNTFDYAPVEAFFSDFYYPGLLTDVFAVNRPIAPSEISQKDRRQPQLKLLPSDPNGLQALTARNVRVKIDVSQAAAGARDVRLFRNGSLVKVWRGDVLKGQSSVALEVTIPIVAGENRLAAYAFNQDNIKSADATLTLMGGDSLKRKGTLHILAVGVSKYANRDYNLNYITEDATSFASQLKLQQDKLGQYQPVQIKTLLNENATKENVLAELKKFANTVQPEDAVVVYFSGHGKASGDHFYLVPHDLGYLGSRDRLSEKGLQQILKHSISDLELEEAFRGVDAGQTFMIIDACNSGQALENKDEPRRGPMNTRGLAQLAYEKGMYILTASQNVEEAFVSMKLKHSYLTYALVEEGLKTKAADADHNGEVVLREWFNYALARVPKLREEVLQAKSLEEVTPKMKAARSQKSQTPRVFYRRELESNPLVVAWLKASAPR